MENSEGKVGTPFTSENQPEKRGRPKNVFGPLAKANNLSNDDVKKIFKNLLSSRPDELNDVIDKYPTVLTIATANMLAQEIKGELTGRLELTGRKVPVLDKEGNPKLDKKGKPIMTDEVRPERKRSYETVKYMIDRCFGKPTQDVIIGTSIPKETEMLIAQIFSQTVFESASITPLIEDAQVEYIEEDRDEQ